MPLREDETITISRKQWESFANIVAHMWARLHFDRYTHEEAEALMYATAETAELDPSWIVPARGLEQWFTYMDGGDSFACWAKQMVRRNALLGRGIAVSDRDAEWSAEWNAIDAMCNDLDEE